MSCKKCNTSPCFQGECGCTHKVDTECITYNGNSLACTSIPEGINLNDLIESLDQSICDTIDLIGSMVIENVGDGAGVFYQIGNTGIREFRSFPSTDSVSVVENIDEIEITINETWMSDFIEANETPETVTTLTNLIAGNRIATYSNEAGTTYEIDESITTLVDNLNSTFTYTSENGTVTTIDFSSSETNTTITNLIAGNRIGTYTNESSTTFDIDETITTLVDNENNSFTYTSENGTITTFEYIPLQKEISTNYTLLDTDTGYTIFLTNGASNITITVPLGLQDNFECGFLQVGTGTVTFATSGGSVINYPDGLGLIIEGQGYPCFIEKRNSNDEYYLTGNVTS